MIKMMMIMIMIMPNNNVMMICIELQ